MTKAAGESIRWCLWSRSSLVRVLVATVSVGAGNFIYTLGLRAGAPPASLIVAQAAVAVTLATAFVGVVDRRIRPSGAALRYAPRAAVVLALAFAFMVEGMARADASVVVPIAQMGFVEGVAGRAVASCRLRHVPARYRSHA
jgi:hypothetical protein